MYVLRLRSHACLRILVLLGRSGCAGFNFRPRTDRLEDRSDVRQRQHTGSDRLVRKRSDGERLPVENLHQDQEARDTSKASRELHCGFRFSNTPTI